MQAINNFMTNSVFYFAIAAAGWFCIWRAINKTSPAVAGAAKKAATNKLVSVIFRMFK